MRPLLLAVVISAHLTALAAEPVLLLSRRAGYVEALDPQTLLTVSRIQMPTAAERVAGDRSGGRLFVSAPKAPGGGCCTVFALDLSTLRATALIEAASVVTIAGNGKLFTQRGNVGLESFDLSSLRRLPTISGPGVYRLSASPDGRLLFGIANFPKPALDLFDAVEGKRITNRDLGEPRSRTGAWAGSQFYLLESGAPEGKLFAVDDQANLGRPIAIKGLRDGCEYGMLSVGNRLAVYAAFGGKGDERCSDPGGYFAIDPTSGVSSERSSAARFRQMVLSADGLYLYGLDIGAPSWGSVRVVKIDAASGKLVAQRALDADVW